MWKIDPADVINLRRDTSGWAFTRFVDDLIEAEVFYHAIPFSNLWTNRRVNLPDGGVDSELIEPITSSQSGFFEVPTCWQYKGSAYADITDTKIREEVRKPYSSQLIGAGYGYRFCICDSLPDQKREKWEKLIQTEVKKIYRQASPVKVIDADDLARWANDLPAVVIGFHGNQMKNFLHLTTWAQSITYHTPIYVNYQSADNARAKILEHADFSRGCHSVVQLMRGIPGTPYSILDAHPYRKILQFLRTRMKHTARAVEMLA